MAEETGSHQISDWSSLGGPHVDGAAVASWGDGGECQLFAIFADGTFRDRYWDGTSWHDWKSHGDGFTGQPAAAARDADRIDVFAFDHDGRLHHRWWDGTRWVDWEQIPT